MPARLGIRTRVLLLDLAGMALFVGIGLMYHDVVRTMFSGVLILAVVNLIGLYRAHKRGAL
jgi:hypothetical protein